MHLLNRRNDVRQPRELNLAAFKMDMCKGATLMDEDEAMRVVEEELLGRDGFLVRLSLKEGLDEEAVARLKDAIKELTTAFRGRSTVPKRLAGAFVDLTPHFERALGLYPQPTQDRIVDAKEEVVDLALTMFGVGHES